MGRSQDIKAEIIGVEGGVNQVGKLDVVALNRGEREELQIGDVLLIYKKGDTDGMYKVTVTDILAKDKNKKDYFKRMNSDRNKKMLTKIENYLKGNKKHFVIVGSLHTLGKEGLVHLLSEKGYTVKQIKKHKKAAVAK